MARSETVDGPPPGSRFRRGLTAGTALRELWAARRLLRALVAREYAARYSQTVLGMSWAVITPLLLMTVFVLVVDRFVEVDTGGASYAAFSYLGLLPWGVVSTSISRGGVVMVLESNLLNKVRCPREVFPLAMVVAAGTDFLVGIGVLGVVFIITGTVPAATTIWVPLLLAVMFTTAAGLALVASILIMYVRDVGQAIPLLLQVGLFATPVAYGTADVDATGSSLYAAINPLVGVIEGLRATVLHGESPPWDLVGPSAASSVVLLVVGYALFKRFEVGIADVA